MENKLFLSDIRIFLEERLNELPPDSIESAFVQWLCPSAQINLSLPSEFSVFDFTHVSQMGYLMVSNGNLYQNYTELLSEGIDRITGRSITGNSLGISSYSNDAVSLLGLALGADYIGGSIKESYRIWLENITDLNNENLPDWKRILIQTALWITDRSRSFQNNTSSENYDLIYALKTRGVECFGDLKIDEVYKSMFSSAIFQKLEFPQVAAKLQFIHNFINHLPSLSLNEPTVEQLVRVLENLTGCFKRWVWEDRAKTSTGQPQKWNIQNEYHVQSLLYFILSPIFPDIESEFYLEPVGQLNSRADIGLPSLNLIIEVKFLRKAKKFQQMIEEVAADNSIYFKRDSVYKNKYSKLFVFLWDDSRRDHEHQIFKNAINDLENVVGTVVISRPGIFSAY